LIAGLSRPDDGAGSIRILSLRDPAKAVEVPLTDAPVREGLAVVGGRVYVSTRDGKLLCLGRP